MNRLAMLAVIGITSTAHADDRLYAVDVSTHARWFGDTSAAILAQEPLAGPRFTLSRAVMTVDAPVRPVAVSLFGRFAFGMVDDKIFNSLDTSLEQYIFTGGIRGDAPLWWRFSLVGQAELGIVRTGLVVTEGQGSGAMTTPVDDHEWHTIGSATLGIDLALIDHPSFKLGLGMELGYTLASPITLHAFPGDRPDDSRSIPTMFAAIGDLDTRGVTFASGLRGSF